MTKKDNKEPQNPPHGGAWRQDQDTGELVLVTEQPEAQQAQPDHINTLGTELNSVPS